MWTANAVHYSRSQPKQCSGFRDLLTMSPYGMVGISQLVSPPLFPTRRTQSEKYNKSKEAHTILAWRISASMRSSLHVSQTGMPRPVANSRKHTVLRMSRCTTGSGECRIKIKEAQLGKVNRDRMFHLLLVPLPIAQPPAYPCVEQPYAFPTIDDCGGVSDIRSHRKVCQTRFEG